jgi:hypothetical protein
VASSTDAVSPQARMEDKSSILKKYLISRMLGQPIISSGRAASASHGTCPECVGLAMPLHSEQGRLHYCVLNRQVLAPRMTDQSAISRHYNLTPENQILGHAIAVHRKSIIPSSPALPNLLAPSILIVLVINTIICNPSSSLPLDT